MAGELLNDDMTNDFSAVVGGGISSVKSNTKEELVEVNYSDTYERFMALEKNHLNVDSTSPMYQDQLYETIQFLKHTIEQRQLNGVLSDNESFFELENTQLYAFALEYYLGILIPKQTFYQRAEQEKDQRDPHRSISINSSNNINSHEQNILLRIGFLNESDMFLSFFLDRCEQMGIISSKKRQEQFEQIDKHHITREEKIKRFQQQKEIETKLKIAQEKKHKDQDLEEIEREQLMLFLQLAVLKAMEEQINVVQEKNMLEEMVKRNAATKEKDLFTEKHHSLPPPQGQGIMVTHINPQFEMRRETIRARVFQPGHRLPTMSLEEYADRELADAKERQQREQEASQVPRRYDQLVEDGDEDDEELVEEATYKDRAWDDWKDANPRGIGNKKGSQF